MTHKTYRAITEGQPPFPVVYVARQSAVELAPGVEFEMAPIDARPWLISGHIEEIDESETDTESRESDSKQTGSEAAGGQE